MKKLKMLFLVLAALVVLTVCDRFRDTGWIEVNSDPEYADVYLDDSLTDMLTNCILEDVDTGMHVVYIELAGYTFGEDTVVVVAGDTVSADFSLNKIGTAYWTYYIEDAEHPMFWESTACPAIDSDGSIYWGSTDGYLYAFNPDGTLRWRCQAGDQIISAPVIGADGTVFFTALDQYLHAVRPDGALKWKVPVATLWFSPAVGSDGTIYVSESLHGGKLCALDGDGNVKWEYQIDFTRSSPVISPDGSIYLLTADLYLWAFDTYGQMKWKYRLEDDVPLDLYNLAINTDGTIYVDGEWNFHAINPNGTLKWRSHVSCASPAVGPDGTIYAGTYALTPNGEIEWIFDKTSYVMPPTVGSDGTIYMVDDDGLLYALNPDGSVRWEYGPLGEWPSAPAISPDGILYIGCADGFFHAIYTDSRGLASSPWPKFAHDYQNTGNAAFSGW